jgi:hypothetical protein
MNKWLQSFLLHPFFNRFNMLYLASWFLVGVGTKVPHVFIGGLSVEVLYLVVRAIIDRSGKPMFQIRKLPSSSKRRFIEVSKQAAYIEKNFEAADPYSKLLNTSLTQAKRLLRVFIDLLLMENRIDKYIRTIRENFDQKIAQLKQQVAQTDGEIKRIAEKNLEIYEKRRNKYLEMVEKKQIIDGRLNTIENTLKLLADTSAGIKGPEDTEGQIEMLISNVEDAESILGEFNQAVPLETRERVR